MDAIGLVCQDQNIGKTIKFYSNFGLKFSQSGDSDHWEATLPTGMRLMLDSVSLMKQINPNFQETQGSGIVLCFKQSSSQAVDSLFDQLKEEDGRVIKAPWDAFWGQRYSSILDPNGYQVDLFAELESKE